MIKVNCKYCGTEIIRCPSQLKNRKNIFCSRTCKGYWQHKHKEEINQHLRKQIVISCNQCGKRIKRPPSQIKKTNFCSNDCFHIWQKENWQKEKSPRWKGGKITVSCSSCGNLIKVSKHRSRNFKNNFCNHKCYATWKATQIGENSNNWGGGKLTVKCANCGKQVKRIRSEVENRSEKFFCNTKCMGEWRSKNYKRENHPNWKGRIIVQCSYCGNDIEKERWRPKTKYHFCNYKCFGKWKSENITGDMVYNWKGGRLPYYGPNWNSQKYKARKRDNFTCQVCHITEKQHIKKYNQKLHVHHIKPFREFNYVASENDNYKGANGLSNLLTVCCVCHRIVESS